MGCLNDLVLIGCWFGMRLSYILDDCLLTHLCRTLVKCGKMLMGLLEFGVSPLKRMLKETNV